MSNIGHRIKKVRKILDISSPDFLEAVGLSSGALSDIETGKRNPPFEAFLKICDLIYQAGFNLDWFLMGKGDPLKPVDKSAVKNLPSVEEMLAIPEKPSLRLVGKNGDAHGFDVPFDDEGYEGDEDSLTDEERELIKIFRGLSQKGKWSVLGEATRQERYEKLDGDKEETGETS